MVRATKQSDTKQFVLNPSSEFKTIFADTSVQKKTGMRKAKSPEDVTDSAPKQKTSSKTTKTKKAKVSKVPKSQPLIETSELDNPKSPVPLSKSSTYKQVVLQKQKVKARKSSNMKKKVLGGSKHDPNKRTIIIVPKKTSETAAVPPADRFLLNQDNDLQKMSNREIDLRIKRIKKRDSQNSKKMKEQYFTSALSEMHKQDLENALFKISTDIPKTDRVTPFKKKKQMKKVSKTDSTKSPEMTKIRNKIVSGAKKIIKKANDGNKKSANSPHNSYPSKPDFDLENLNIMKREGSSGSLTTHFRSVTMDRQSSKLPVKKHPKAFKVKKIVKPKMEEQTSDVKTAQISHKKKSKANTSKLTKVQSSDSVPNLPVREIKHNDSFVISARKLENAVNRRTNHPKPAAPDHLKLKAKRPSSAKRPYTTSELLKTDISKPEQLKSCLKKNWIPNKKDTPINYEDVAHKFGLSQAGYVPLVY